jgi:hypothetical protein
LYFRGTTRAASCIRATLSGLAGLMIATGARDAAAQIKEPGNHPKYAVELEPHALAQWSGPYWGDAGGGVGVRASIPIIENGPVTTINNSLAIGFGLDWAHYGGGCWDWGPWLPAGPRPAPPPDFRNYRCSGDSFWLPVVAQWNFFFTPVVSVFAELGLGIEYATWGADYPCAGGVCRPTGHDLFVDPLFFVGPRFTLSNDFAITLRIGWPYVSVGASFLL